MNRLKLNACVFGAAALLLAGCASTAGNSSPPKFVQSSAKSAEPELTAAAEPRRKDPNELVCQRYKPTGSHRSVTRCVTRAQKTAERDAAQMSLQRATGPNLSENGVSSDVAAAGTTP